MTAVAQRLDAALSKAIVKQGRFKVKLANVGNPDYGQDPRRPLPDTVCAWAQVDSPEEASELCQAYIAYFDLGGGNWTGGEIVRNSDGLIMGQISYNGR